MTHDFEGFQKLSKEQLETATTTSSSFAKSIQTIVAETTDYSKKSLETSSAFVKTLLGAKSLDSALRLQLDYAKSSHAVFAAQVTRIAELYCNLAKETFKPIELAITKVQATELG
jgi:hypothetical protein